MAEHEIIVVTDAPAFSDARCDAILSKPGFPTCNKPAVAKVQLYGNPWYFCKKCLAVELALQRKTGCLIEDKRTIDS